MKRKIMFFGGSGRVGSLVVPFFIDDFEVHVYDLRPPKVDGAVYHPGDITDRDAVRAAIEGMDVVVYMVMAPHERCEDVSLSYDLNLKGLHLVLEAAQDSGIERVIHCSTGTVHDDQFCAGECVNDDMTPRASNVYGMTKALGEQVCTWFCEHFGMTIFVLRLYWPASYETWNEVYGGDQSSVWAYITTLDRDVARAFRLALDSPRRGCSVMSICGDWRHRRVNCERAREQLGWQATPWPAPAR